jgi:hypothetical protein
MTLLEKAWRRYRRDGLDSVVRTAWQRTSTSLRTRLHACNPERRRTLARLARSGAVDARLRSSGFELIPLELSAAEFQRWFASATYPADYCPGPWRKTLPEKALEHYLSP